MKKVRTFNWYCDGANSHINIYFEDGTRFCRTCTHEDAMKLCKEGEAAIPYLIDRYTQPTIKLSGGFHNVPPKTLRLTHEAYKAIIATAYWNERLMLWCADGEALDHYLTPYQKKALGKHFCGINGCTCGGYHRDCVIDDWEETK